MVKRKIKFCQHAEAKFQVLRDHGFPVSKKQVVNVLKNAEKIETGEGNRKISQKAIDNNHVLRVIHEKIDNIVVVITFYPGRKKYYEN